MALFDFFFRKPPTITVSSDPFEKSVKPVDNVGFLEGQLEKSKAVFSLESHRDGADKVQKKRGRLSDKDLRDVASYDSIISLIVNNRSNQMMSFGRHSRGKYERGFILQEINPISRTKGLSPDALESEVQYRTDLGSLIVDRFLACGTKNELVKQYAFSGSDSYFKDCSLAEFLYAQTYNLLVFGRCATQILRNTDGVIIMFRPLPVESIFRVLDQEDVSLSVHRDAHPESVKDVADYLNIPKGKRPTAYIQKMDGKNVAFFTEDELIMTYARKQALEGLEGYPLAPIEQAYYMVSLHFYAQQYMQNSLTKGLASKGIINLQTTEGGVVNPEQTENFRKMFSNYVARNDNSATIPVISGPIKVEFIELNATSKDLEFLNLYNKVIMVLCASFQISPEEIGFGNLDSAKPSLGGGSTQDQIVQGEERGLRQLADTLFDHLNFIMGEIFPEAKGIFRFTPIGLGQNTKEADLALYKEELQTSGTFGKIWSDSERVESFPFGADVPTSPIFHTSVARYVKMAEMRYHFFGDKNALEDPSLDFFLDPGFDAAYQMLKSGAQQMEIQRGQMELEQMSSQGQQQDEQHQMALAQSDQQMAHADVEQEQALMAQRQEEEQLQQEAQAEINKKTSQFLQDIIESRPDTLHSYFE